MFGLGSLPLMVAGEPWAASSAGQCRKLIMSQPPLPLVGRNDRTEMVQELTVSVDSREKVAAVKGLSPVIQSSRTRTPLVPVCRIRNGCQGSCWSG